MQLVFRLCYRYYPPRCFALVQFLDKAKIKAILINEGITMHRVVFYLAFVVAGRDKMVVAFENLQPRLNVLIKIYRCVCVCAAPSPSGSLCSVLVRDFPFCPTPLGENRHVQSQPVGIRQHESNLSRCSISSLFGASRSEETFARAN